MIFSCGENTAHKLARMKEWHRWFAWYPVTIDDLVIDGQVQCVWLQFIERSSTWYSGATDSGWIHKYRLIGDNTCD